MTIALAVDRRRLHLGRPADPNTQAHHNRILRDPNGTGPCLQAMLRVSTQLVTILECLRSP